MSPGRRKAQRPKSSRAKRRAVIPKGNVDPQLPAASPNADLPGSPTGEDTLPANVLCPPDTISDDYSPAEMKALCESIAAGLSLTHSNRLLGLSSRYQTWRKSAKQFIDELVANAESQFIATRVKKIAAAGDKYWAANAWLLERRFPTQFGLSGARAGKAGQVGPINIVIMSSVPRPYDIMRRRGLKPHEPGRPPDEIEAETRVIEVDTAVPRRKLTDGEG